RKLRPTRRRPARSSGAVGRVAPGEGKHLSKHLRPKYREEYYGSFLLDPDGNSAEAVHHDLLRRGGVVDHLWIHVADLAAAKRFYETVAPHAGLQLRRDLPERAQFAHGTPHGGSFSLVAGPPTQRLHMAFAASDDATV